MSKRKTSAFDFEDGGRRYSCRVEAPRAGMDAWWWFDVSGDANRYAPFRAEASDTESSVRTRIVKYYEERLAPREYTHRFGRPRAPQPATPAAQTS